MRFAIISAPRFGTHLLRTALNEHPDIHVSREILNPALLKHSSKRGLDILREWCRTSHTEAWVGTLLHRDLYWASRSKEIAVWDEVAKTHGRFVSVVRDNMLRAYLSILVARQLRSWLCFEARVKKASPVHMPPEALVEFCAKCWSYYGKVDTRYSPRHVVTYEEMCLNWAETMAGVQGFLGVPARPLSQVTYKQETRSLQESIRNYSEIAKVVEDLGCARWLD